MASTKHNAKPAKVVLTPELRMKEYPTSGHAHLGLEQDKHSGQIDVVSVNRARTVRIANVVVTDDAVLAFHDLDQSSVYAWELRQPHGTPTLAHAHDGSAAEIQAAVTRVVEDLAAIHTEMMRAFDGALASIKRATRCLSVAQTASQTRKVRLNRLRRALARRKLRIVLGRARDPGMPGFGKLRIVDAHDKVVVTVASIEAVEAWLRERDLRH